MHLPIITRQLTFYRTSDWITGTEEIAGVCQVNDSGDFRFEVDLTATTQLFAYLGIFEVIFLQSPAKLINWYYLNALKNHLKTC